MVGAIRVELAISTTAESFDVDLEGRGVLLTEGIGRLTSSGTLTIDLGVTANAFRPGHALRILLTGASYPRYAMNPQRATATLHRGRLLLPARRD